MGDDARYEHRINSKTDMEIHRKVKVTERERKVKVTERARERNKAN